MSKAKLRVPALLTGIVLILGGCDLTKTSKVPDDSAIVAQIQSKLYQDPVLKTREVHVVSQKGVVVLTGNVGSSEEKASVEHLAQGADGVKQVVDELAVSDALAASSEPSKPAVREPVRPEARRPIRRSERATASNNANAEPPAPAPAAAPVVPAPAPAPPPPPPQPVNVTIPAGTVITVRTVDVIDSSVNHPGDEFSGTVDSPVVEGNRVVIPRYSNARIRLVEARSAGHIKGQSELQLELVSLSVNGKSYQVNSGVYQQQAAGSRGKRSAEVIGGGAGLGALIGAIAGGGKGAAIGAAIGAGGGTAVQATTKGQQVKIPSETKIDFTLRSPVTLVVNPDQPASESPAN